MAKKNTINPSGKRQGRPPIPYYTEYCELLIEHMSKGYSFESFGANLNPIVSHDTLSRWTEEYPDFCVAKKQGEAASRKWWENTGHEGMTGLLPGFIPSIYIFMMKNKFGMRDVVDLNAKTQHTNVNLNVNVEGKVNDLVAKLSELLDVKKEAAPIKDVTPIRIKSSDRPA